MFEGKRVKKTLQNDMFRTWMKILQPSILWMKNWRIKKSSLKHCVGWSSAFQFFFYLRFVLLIYWMFFFGSVGRGKKRIMFRYAYNLLNYIFIRFVYFILIFACLLLLRWKLEANIINEHYIFTLADYYISSSFFFCSVPFLRLLFFTSVRQTKSSMKTKANYFLCVS